MLIQTAHQTDFASALANHNRRGEQGMGVRADRALYISGVARALDAMLPAVPADDMKLMCGQLGDSDRRVARSEDLKQRRFFLGAQSTEQADDPMRFESVF
jgi:hypothetical protein